MSIDFSRVVELSDAKGIITQVTDANGNIVWAGNSKVVLMVEKMISNTYGAETIFENEEFILLDIYPRIGGTVKVTYGGLTKTIIDDGTSEEPNAVPVFFGTFNGVSDDIATPSSGKLIIEGDVYGFGCTFFQTSGEKNFGLNLPKYNGVRKIISFGQIDSIPPSAFGGAYMAVGTPNELLETVTINNGVKSIGGHAFGGCTNLKKLSIPASVESIGANIVTNIKRETNFISVSSKNTHYKIDGGCLMEIATKTLLVAFPDSTIPSYTEIIGEYSCNDFPVSNLVIPANVKEIRSAAFSFNTSQTERHITMLPVTPPTLSSTTLFGTPSDTLTIIVTVPKGCSAAYKAHESWANYVDCIVEAS